MGDKSHIQWTDATWNPVAGCVKVSEGCRNCYAIRDGHRMASNPNPKLAATYSGLTMIQKGRLNWTGVVKELPERLDQPLRWKKPRRIFVNSQSDLFHADVSFEFIWRVFEVMRNCPRHHFQLLTKRPERMRDFFLWLGVEWALGRRVFRRGWLKPEDDDPRVLCDTFGRIWPEEFPHVWLGVSVEDQKAADERIPLLLQTPAAVRFLSSEPLLGAVDLTRFLGDFDLSRNSSWGNLHWVIVGGESGPGARPMELDWARAIVSQCKQAGVPCFVKQLGSAWGFVGADRKGANMEEWPADLRVREFPVPRPAANQPVERSE